METDNQNTDKDINEDMMALVYFVGASMCVLIAAIAYHSEGYGWVQIFNSQTYSQSGRIIFASSNFAAAIVTAHISVKYLREEWKFYSLLMSCGFFAMAPIVFLTLMEMEGVHGSGGSVLTFAYLYNLIFLLALSIQFLRKEYKNRKVKGSFFWGL